MQVRTNNHKRPVIYGHELSEAERKEFDYLDWSSQNDSDVSTASFFRFKGHLYDLGDAMSFSGSEHAKPWQGYYQDTAFSMIVIQYPRETFGEFDPDHVIVGTAFSG